MTNKKVFALGHGFIASHLNYPQIEDRLEPNSQQIKSVLEKYKPDVLINTIGFCGIPNIDQCENEKERTILSNTVIPILLALECSKLNIHLIHIGSGCIFNGPSPNIIHVQNDGSPIPDTLSESFMMSLPCKTIDLGWKETDAPNPVSFYSQTKAAFDLAGGLNDFTTILRIRMPISPKRTARNFLTKISNYSQLIDRPNSVTFTNDIVRAVDFFIENQKTGIFHLTNPGTLSAAEAMQEYKRYNPEHKFEIISTDQLDKITTAKRSNCILNTDKLNKLGFQMEDAKTALKECMKGFCNGSA
jgi:UDP-glucose 4,6-dehydratase